MTNRKIEVAALTVDQGNLIFYKVDGTTFVVTQGDPRGPVLIDSFIEQKKSLGKDAVVVLSLEEDTKIGHLSSSKRNPLVRFFVASTEAVRKLFGKQSHETGFTEESHEAAAAKVREIASRLMKPDAEMTTELPVRVVNSETPMQEDETIIAVSEHGLIPGVENLTDQFQAAEEGKAPAQGADNLLIRLTKISSKRGHTAQEALNFIKKIDLPITADGAFLAYKRLIHKGNGVYVDPHSKKVHQRIGDTVQMDASLVDANRRVECSQGIHVGTRKYMGGFHQSAEGSGTCLVLIQPEDVIAVPQGEADKMRVCRYVLLGDLSKKAHDLVNTNKAMDDCTETMGLLAGIIAGGRPPMLGVVNIGGAGGTNLTYTVRGHSISTDKPYTQALALSKGQATLPTSPVVPVRTIDSNMNGNKAGLEPMKIRNNESKVKPADIQAKAAAPKAAKPAPAKPSVPVAPSRNDIAQAYAIRMRDKNLSVLERGESAQELANLKKKSKVSWDKLGVSGKDPSKEIEAILSTKVKPVLNQKETKSRIPDGHTVVTPAKPTLAPVAKQAAKVQAKPEPKAQPVKAKPHVAKPASDTHQDAHQKRAVAEFEAGGRSKAQIASKYGTSPKSIDRWIAKYGKTASISKPK